MAPSAERIASIMRDVRSSRTQNLANELAGDDENYLTQDVPVLTGEVNYYLWWQALRHNLQTERPHTYWDAFGMAVNDGMNLMDDEEVNALSPREYEQHVVLKALYIILLRRVVRAIRSTISPALNESSRSVGTHPFVLLWWIQSRFDECQPENLAFMPELIRDLKIQKGPQQRVLDISDTWHGWDDWDGFDMDRVGLTTYVQLIGNEKPPA